MTAFPGRRVASLGNICRMRGARPRCAVGFGKMRPGPSKMIRDVEMPWSALDWNDTVSAWGAFRMVKCDA